MALLGVASAELAAQAPEVRLREHATVPVASGKLRSMAASPDPRWIAIAGEAGDVQIIDSTTGEPRWTTHLTAHYYPPELRFSPDGEQLLVISDLARVLSCKDGRVLKRLGEAKPQTRQAQIIDAEIAAASFDADGNRLALVLWRRRGNLSSILILDAETWKLQSKQTLFGRYHSVDFDVPRNSWILVGPRGRLFTIDAENRVDALDVIGITVSTTMRASSRLALYDQRHGSGDGYSGAFRSTKVAAVSPDLKRAATYDGPDTGIEVSDSRRQSTDILRDLTPIAMSFAPDGALLVATEDSRIHRVLGDQVQATIPYHVRSGPLRALAFSRDGRYIVSAGDAVTVIETLTGVARTIDIDAQDLLTGQNAAEFVIASDQGIQRFDAARDLTELASWSPDELAALDNVTKSTLGVHALQDSKRSRSIDAAWSSKGMCAIGRSGGAHNKEGLLVVEDEPRGAGLQLEFEHPVLDVEFSPTGSQLIIIEGAKSSAVANNTVHRMDTASMQVQSSRTSSICQWEFLDETTALVVTEALSGEKLRLRNIELWTTEGSPVLQTVKTFAAGQVAIAPSHDWIAIENFGQVQVYELERR